MNNNDNKHKYAQLAHASWNQDCQKKCQQSKEELKRLLMRVKEESEKAGLKLSIQKIKIMSSGPMTSLQIKGEKVEAVTDFIFLGSIITTTVTAVTELKDTHSSERKQWPT